MKKKIIALFLAATVATTSLCMTACGNDTANDPPLKSDKVANEEEWETAFFGLGMSTDKLDITNGTLSVEFSGVDFKYKNSVMIFDDNKIKRARTYNQTGKTETEYIECRDDEIYESDQNVYEDARGTVYRYYLDEQTKKWKVEKSAIDRKYSFRKEVYDELYVTGKIDSKDHGSDICPWDLYSYFKYDESAYQYVLTYDKIKELTGENHLGISSMTVKIKNGKLAEFTSSGTYKDLNRATGSAKITITDIGNSKVDLPKISA